jgi:hypothetical protein
MTCLRNVSGGAAPGRARPMVPFRSLTAVGLHPQHWRFIASPWRRLYTWSAARASAWLLHRRIPHA